MMLLNKLAPDVEGWVCRTDRSQGGDQRVNYVNIQDPKRVGA